VRYQLEYYQTKHHFDKSRAMEFLMDNKRRFMKGLRGQLQSTHWVSALVQSLQDVRRRSKCIGIGYSQQRDK